MGLPLRVLIVEDSETDVHLVVRELKKGGYDAICKSVCSESSMKVALVSRDWDLVISDYCIPGFGGLEALELFKKSGLDVPFIIISGTIGEDTAVETLKMGANDYLLKSNLRRLIPSIQRELREAAARRESAHTKKAYQENLYRLAAIVESSRDAIIGKTLDGVITSWNQGAERIYGYGTREVLGKHISFLVPPNHKDEISSLLESLKRGETIENFETQRMRKDGSIVDVSLTVSPVKNQVGKVIGAAAIDRDITDQKKFQQELVKKNEELERLSRLKSEFMTMVTHELRTPLTALMEGVNLILDGVDGPVTAEQKGSLTLVKRNVERLGRMVSNVLDFQKLESGVGQLHFGDYDLKGIAQEITETIRPEAEKKSIQLELSLPEAPIIVHCDADRIKQVLLNLAMNAVKFTDPSGQIGIELSVIGHEGERAHLAVKDSGVGIKEEDRERIFEMFNQSTTRGYWRTGGFGVGLTVCKKIVELHHGKIWIEGLEGQGSRFIVEFPRRPQESFPPLQQVSMNRKVS